MMRWSDKAWEAIAPLYRRIIEMPFILELQRGTLPLPTFQFYMAQDSHYLGHFGGVLAAIAARLPDAEDALAFIRFAEGAIVVENALHEGYFKEFGVQDKGEIQPVCHHYVHFLKATASTAAVEVAVAAVLPCFWIYERVGKHIYAQKTPQNPYQKWIDTYAGEEFNASVQKALAIGDKLAAQASENVRAQMLAAFITASRLEYRFWEAAYNREIWL